MIIMNYLKYLMVFVIFCLNSTITEPKINNSYSEFIISMNNQYMY